MSCQNPLDSRRGCSHNGCVVPEQEKDIFECDLEKSVEYI